MIFKINYYLFFLGQYSIYCYCLPFAKHYAHVQTSTFGILMTIIPIMLFIVKPYICQKADANIKHRQYLIANLTVFLVSYGSMLIIAFLKDPHNYKADLLVWTALSILLTTGSIAMTSIFSLSDTLVSNYARKHNISYGSIRLYGYAGYCSGAVLDIFVGHIDWLPFRVPSLIVLCLATSANILFLKYWPYDEDFEMFHDGTTIRDRKLSIVGPNTLAFVAQRYKRQSISRDFIHNIKAARSKSVAAINLDKTALNRKQIPKTMKLESVDDVTEMKKYSNVDCQLILLKEIALGHKSLIKFGLLFFAFGAFQNTIITYEMEFLKTVVPTSRVVGLIGPLTMVGQTCGEAPTMAFSGYLVKWFGINALASLAFVTIGLRFFFYANIFPYVPDVCILFSEILQGPSMAIMVVCIVEAGSHYALMVTEFIPKLREKGIVRDKNHEKELEGCLRATMIGLLSGCFEGPGMALGALIGGVLSEISYNFLWNLQAIFAFIIGFLIIGRELDQKLLRNKPIDDSVNVDIEIPKIEIISP